MPSPAPAPAPGASAVDAAADCRPAGGCAAEIALHFVRPKTAVALAEGTALCAAFLARCGLRLPAPLAR
jgi:hypothetical protein